MLYKFQLGRAPQGRLATRFHAPGGHKRSRKEGGHQQPWSSERCALHGDRPGTRNMAIPATGSTIISGKRAAASVRLRLLIRAWSTRSACGSHSCCASASHAVGSAVPWACVSRGSCTVGSSACRRAPITFMSRSPHVPSRSWCPGWKPKPIRGGVGSRRRRTHKGSGSLWMRPPATSWRFMEGIGVVRVARSSGPLCRRSPVHRRRSMPVSLPIWAHGGSGA